MQIFKNPTETLDLSQPVILTIGNYDGVHLGHQTIINRVLKLAHIHNTQAVLITFDNHPVKVLRPETTIFQLCTLSHKTELLKSQGIDILLLFHFTLQFSKQTAHSFLRKIYDLIPFSHLVLGPDATIGKEKEGNRCKVTEIAKEMNFTVEYLPPLKIDEEKVSSSVIRRAVQQGNLALAEQMLGRPFSILTEVISGQGNGRRIGYPTANLSVQDLCLPPFGVWAVTIKHEGIIHSGIANLGFAPTLRSDKKPLLEVHLFDKEKLLYGEHIEIIFTKFIRPEIQFNSLETLKAQIKEDIKQAKQH